ncbi:hypothetical protein HAX54_019450 [Datura stramonium]|uniref:Uncharacterized protein n=1 Tax=Datura stramonium TaxID=4076 RepID=A0ABS8URJ7_DATST|nr:hypothetical protein [Datura stramonium]
MKLEGTSVMRNLAQDVKFMSALSLSLSPLHRSYLARCVSSSEKFYPEDLRDNGTYGGSCDITTLLTVDIIVVLQARGFSIIVAQMENFTATFKKWPKIDGLHMTVVTSSGKFNRKALAKLLVTGL